MTVGAVDLFCGVGGLTYGLQQAGIEVVAGIDKDNSCDYVYSHNNHSAFICKDIERFSGRELNALLDGFDVKVLAGCAPCQPFSSHQKDKANRSKHKDWRILYRFAQLVKETRPNIITMENVSELRQEKVFTDFVSMLREEHYFVDFGVVKSSEYGVPQRRRRLILLASLFGPIHLIEKTHSTPKTVRDAIGGLPKIGAGEKNPDNRMHVALALSEKNMKRILCSLPGGTWRDWPQELVLECHKGEAGRRYQSVYGRMSWDDVAPTMTTQFTCYGTGRFGHPEQNRALTLLEGSLLQTFPNDYSFVPDDKEVLIKIVSRQIGNAVPPRLGEVIGLSIRRHLETV